MAWRKLFGGRPQIGTKCLGPIGRITSFADIMQRVAVMFEHAAGKKLTGTPNGTVRRASQL